MSDVNFRISSKYDKSGVDKATSGLSALNSKIDGLGKIASGAIAGTIGVMAVKALKAAADAAGEAMRAFGEQEAAVKKLEAAIALNPTMNGEASDSLQRFASELQKTTIHGDELTLSLAGTLAAMGRNEGQIKDIITAATDLSAATGMTLDSAVKNLNKTLSGMTGELGEAIPSLRGMTKEQLEAGGAIEWVQKNMGTLAEELANTTSGGVEQFKNALGDLKEEAGRLLSGFFTPIRARLTEMITDFNNARAAARDFKEALENDDAGAAAEADAKSYARFAQTIAWGLEEALALYGEWDDETTIINRTLVEMAQRYDTSLISIAQIAKEQGLVTDEQLAQNALLQDLQKFKAAEEHQQRKIALASEYTNEQLAIEAARQEELNHWVGLRLEAEDRMRSALARNAKLAEVYPGLYDEAALNAAALRKEIEWMVEQGFESFDLSEGVGGLSKLILEFQEQYEYLGEKIGNINELEFFRLTQLREIRQEYENIAKAAEMPDSAGASQAYQSYSQGSIGSMTGAANLLYMAGNPLFAAGQYDPATTFNRDYGTSRALADPALDNPLTKTPTLATISKTAAASVIAYMAGDPMFSASSRIGIGPELSYSAAQAMQFPPSTDSLAGLPGPSVRGYSTQMQQENLDALYALTYQLEELPPTFADRITEMATTFEERVREGVASAIERGQSFAGKVEGFMENPVEGGLNLALDGVMAFGEMIGGLVQKIVPLISAFTSVNALLNPLQTILQVAMQTLAPVVNSLIAPLVGILVVLGQTLGAILAPAFQALAPVVQFISEAFVWLYNKAIIPLATGITTVLVSITSAIGWVFESIRVKIDNIGKLPKFREEGPGDLRTWVANAVATATSGFEEINLDDLTDFGETYITQQGGPLTTPGPGSETNVYRQPDINVHIYAEQVNGPGGMAEFGRLVADAILEYTNVGGRVQFLEATA